MQGGGALLQKARDKTGHKEQTVALAIQQGAEQQEAAEVVATLGDQ